MAITRATNLAGLGTVFDALTDGGGLSISGISTFTDLNVTRANVTGVSTAAQLNVGSAFIVDNSGAIGIGTTNPRSKIDIQGSNSELRFYRDAGDRFGGIRYIDSLWTFRLPTNDVLAVTSAGDNEELLRVTAAGKVGVGTIPSDFGNSANSVEIYSPNSTQTYLSLTNTTTGASGVTNGLNLCMIGTSARILNRESGGDIQIQIGGEERFRMNSSGITTITSDGVDANGANLTLKHDNNNTTDVISSILFTNNIGEAARIQGETVGANNYGEITFYTAAAGSSVERLRIDSSGLVGIATNNPQLANLHIGAGTYALNIQNNGDNSSYILFSKNATPDDARAWIQTNGELSGGYMAFAAADGERFRINNNGIGIGTDDASYGLHICEDSLLMTSGHGSTTNTDIKYWHRVASASESARIRFANTARDGSAYTANEPGDISFWTRPSDNEGSGQSKALQKRLTVHSDGRLFIDAGNCSVTSGSDAALRIRGNYDDATRSTIILLETATQGRGKILTGNADADPPTFAASSDRRMKTNIRPYFGGYEKIKAIPVKMFDLTVGTCRTDNIGWIADEVSPIFPDAVLGEPDAERVLGFCTDTQGNVTCTDVLESCACEGDTWTETHREPVYQSLAPLAWYPELINAVQTLIAKVESLESAVGIAST